MPSRTISLSRFRAFALVAVLSGASAALAGPPASPIEVRIEAPDEIPGPGESFPVTAIVSAALDAPGTLVQFHASEGLRISGRRNFRLDLSAGESATFETTASIVAPGDHTLTVRARRVVDAEREIWGDIASAFFHSTDGGATAPGFGPRRDGAIEALVAPEGEPVLADIDPSQGLAVTPGMGRPEPHAGDGTSSHGGPASIASGDTTISIQLLGLDPRDAQIEVGPFFGEVLNARTNVALGPFYTDPSGRGFACFTNPGADGFYVRFWSFYSRNTAPGDENLLVVRPNNTSGWPEAHKVWTPAFYSLGPGTWDLGTWALGPGSNQRGAFSLLRQLTLAFRYILDNGGGGSPEGVEVEWQADSTVGTFYTLGGEIQLKAEVWGTPVDPAEPDVMIREYALAIMYHVYGDTFPPRDCPGPHYMWEAYTFYCAWAEGWADFLPLVVHGDPVLDYPGGGLRIDIESPTWGTPGWAVGPTCEGRVAGVLLDLFDETNDGFDGSTFGFDEIWDVIYNTNSITFPQFYGNWIARGHDYCALNAIVYQNTIDYSSPPTLSGIPNVSCLEDVACERIIDLWNFVGDSECPAFALTFSLSVSDERAGVILEDNRYVSIVPVEPNFAGQANVTVTVLDPSGRSAADTFVVTITEVNDPPATPSVPSGPEYGLTTATYTFSSFATDEDGDSIQIRFDFGDGNVSDFSALVPSGNTVNWTYAYLAEGRFSMRAQARDSRGATSAYSSPFVIDVADVAIRYGNVGADGGGGPVPVLTVNGSIGNPFSRVLPADNDFPLDVALDVAPAGPADPRFAIWGFLGGPTSTTDFSLPFDSGRMCVNPVFQSCGAPCPVYAVNTVGKCARVLCSTPEAVGTVAGGLVLRIPAGSLAAGTLVTFQGVIQDASDQSSPLQYSVTNAIIVRMTE